MRSSIFSSRLVVFGLTFSLLTAIGLTVGIGLVRSLGDFVPEDELEDRCFINKVSDRHYPICLYGDSRTCYGISPSVVSGRLGQVAMNLAFSGGGINAEMLAFVDRKLDKSAVRKTVILGVTPRAMLFRTRENLHYHEILKKSQNGVAGLNRRWDGDLLSKIRLMRKSRKERKNDERRTFCEDGWTPLALTNEKAVPRRIERCLNDYRAYFKSSRFSEESMSELLAWIRRWRDEGVSVVLFRVPSCRQMVELERQCSNFPEADFARRVVEAGAQWVTLDLGGYPTHDGTHLTAQGSQWMTRDLCDAILNP